MSIELESGFSAFTGETGAGKSIMIDAISTLISSRSSTQVVSKGKEKAIIEATFDLRNDKNACQLMEESGFDVNEETTFTKEILSSGKTNARIDHRVVTQSLMKDILKDQIDIHGQRDTAYLLNASTHLHLLDAYANDESELQQVTEAFKVYDSLVKEKETALKETYNESDAEFFSYQIKEIEDADLKEGEDEELASKEKQYKLLKDSIDKLSSIFNEYDDSVSSGLYDVNKQIQSLKSDETIESIQNASNDAYYAFNDAIEQLRSYYQDFDISEEDVNQMEERLFEIQRLKRKYGRTITDILEKKEELVKQVEMITHRQEYLNEIDSKIDKALADYTKKASKLSAIRNKASKQLDKEIETQLKDLMLENAKFSTMVENSEPSKYGSDHVEFLIAMNKGEDLKPLSKTASGGELSRLMLGLKVIFTKLEGIETVIFDEIDTGVSGPVATAIGKKMQLLGSDVQVFSVTHLAQVAACSDHHYFISKNSDDTTTTSSIKLLNNEESIEQIATIASGEVTDASIAAAQELVQRNKR